MSAQDLRDLAAWTDRAARWLERSARRPNDDDDPTRRTVTFDAATLDEFMTGFRGMTGVIEAIAANVERRPDLRIVAGGQR